MRESLKYYFYEENGRLLEIRNILCSPTSSDPIISGHLTNFSSFNHLTFLCFSWDSSQYLIALFFKFFHEKKMYTCIFWNLINWTSDSEHTIFTHINPFITTRAGSVFKKLYPSLSNLTITQQAPIRSIQAHSSVYQGGSKLQLQIFSNRVHSDLFVRQPISVGRYGHAEFSLWMKGLISNKLNYIVESLRHATGFL